MAGNIFICEMVIRNDRRSFSSLYVLNVSYCYKGMSGDEISDNLLTFLLPSHGDVNFDPTIFTAPTITLN